MRRQGICHVHTRVRSPFLNGKIERFFRSLKQWRRLALLATRTASIQRRLDTFADWYNRHRPHSALGIRTPQEAFANRKSPKPVPIRARDGPS
ncbi:MAG: integrase core domain-containing protein, partial [Thermoplasmata archaeon]